MIPGDHDPPLVQAVEPVQIEVAADRSPRTTSSASGTSAGSCSRRRTSTRIAGRMPGDERHVDRRRRTSSNPPCIGSRQRLAGVPVGVADDRDQIGRGAQRLGVALVDPVPGEVRERRRTGRRRAPAAAHAERRRVGDDEPGVVLAQKGGFRGGALRRSVPMELRGAADRRLLVEAQAVDLDDPGVAGAVDEREGTGGRCDRTATAPRPCGRRCDRSGQAAASALMISISRDACPNPWPEM